MPIYAYKCSACGHAKDILQKISDDPLTQCPACLALAFTKQVTAAGFQLKGSGWYVTDFKGGSSAPAPAASEGGSSTGDATTTTDASVGSTASTSESAPSATTSAAPAATTTSTTSAASCGTSCACH